jgi:CBS domain-containing protein
MNLANISQQLKNDSQVPTVSKGEFLSWFGTKRRGLGVGQIRRQLDQAGLETEPDFESARSDAQISFRLKTAKAQTTGASVRGDGAADLETTVFADPTFRISKLAAARNKPTSIKPTETIEQAVTLMLSSDFSQLPVMTSARDVKGIISWSSIGSRLALGKSGRYVFELMDDHHEIRSDMSLFDAIPRIVQHQYVLIRGSDNRITGIVTATDLSSQFQQLAEPFLLLGQIENHVRRLIGDKFAPEELRSVARYSERVINDVADLTFGDYVRLLENEQRWKKLSLSIDRQEFCTRLDRVREIRNDVMHFDPEGILQKDLEHIRSFANFLARLQTIGIPEQPKTKQSKIQQREQAAHDRPQRLQNVDE